MLPGSLTLNSQEKAARGPGYEPAEGNTYQDRRKLEAPRRSRPRNGQGRAERIRSAGQWCGHTGGEFQGTCVTHGFNVCLLSAQVLFEEQGRGEQVTNKQTSK